MEDCIIIRREEGEKIFDRYRSIVSDEFFDALLDLVLGNIECYSISKKQLLEWEEIKNIREAKKADKVTRQPQTKTQTKNP